MKSVLQEMLVDISELVTGLAAIVDDMDEDHWDEPKELPFDPNSAEARIGMLTWGNPMLNLDNPVRFRMMEKYADPLRRPFTQTSWITSGWGGVDVRPRLASPRDVDAEIQLWLEENGY